MSFFCAKCGSLKVIITFVNYEKDRVLCGIPSLYNDNKVVFSICCEDCSFIYSEWVNVGISK